MSKIIVKIPRSKSEILYGIGIILILLFAYSRLSWGYFISSSGWGVILLISISSLILARIVKGKYVIKLDIVETLMILMLGVIILNNNFDTQHGFFASSIFPYICMLIMFITCSKSEEWIKYAIFVMMFCAIFYMVMTIFCNVNTEFYYYVVHPLMQVYGTSYTAHPSAGFTAHYSTNGLYLAMGFCVIIAVSYFRVDGNSIRLKSYHYFLITIEVMSLLICGKRGIILCLGIAVFIGYRNYTVENKNGRVLKIFAAFLSIGILMFLLSFFIPSISYTMERFLTTDALDSNTNQRFQLWKFAWNSFLQKPIFGYGWRWFKYSNTVAKGMDAHNVFFQLLAENGIVGSIPFYCFFVISFFRAFKLSIYVRKNKSAFSKKQTSYVFLALLNESFMIPFMFEGTALYMSECMVTYFLSCAIVQYYWANIVLYRID